MMKYLFTRCLFTIGILAICVACSDKSSLAAFYDYETECIGTEYDGSLTLRAWGDGNTRQDAIDQAVKRAIHDVVFVGITKGLSGNLSKPLLLEANAEEKYEDYFNKFFADRGGDFRKFANFKDEKENSVQVAENRQVYKYGVTVRVLRADLKAKLKEDGIIKN